MNRRKWKTPRRASAPRTAGAWLRLLCVVAALVPALVAKEVQHHGLVFEQWVRGTFFENYSPSSYTQRWDIPADANRAHGGIPVNPKATKYGMPVDLGDALRQFDIAEPFILVIGYWRQEGEVKRFVNIVAPRIDPEVWARLWASITRADLERLDAVIKDPSLTPAQARAAARKLKLGPPFTEAIMQVNPKIDSKTQRRLQCSLRFADVFRYLAADAGTAPQAQPNLWGVEFPSGIASGPRPRR